MVEPFADLEQQIPQGDVVGHAGGAHCAQVDGVKTGQLFHAVFGHHAAGLQVVFAAPGEGGAVKGERAVQRGHMPQYPQAFLHHFGADAVAADDGDLVVVHEDHSFLFLSDCKVK